MLDVYEPSRLCAPDARVNLGRGHAQRLGEFPVWGRFLAEGNELEQYDQVLRFQRKLMINLAFHTYIRYLRIANIRMARRIGNPWFRALMSPLTRDSVECERAIRRLEFSGLRIVATSDGYDSTSKARKVHRGFKGLMNEIFLDDLRERVHRGLAGQAMKRYWCGGRPYGYRLKPVVDASKLDVYGQPSRVGTVLEIDDEQAAVAQEIFARYADGASCLAIARELNSRGVPSPGSTWKRKARRCKGWMGSAVRVILRNPLYCGPMRWNASQFVRDPDTGKHKRRRRPRAEWVEHQDESLRIISDVLFEQAQARTRVATNSDKRLKSGGRSKYLLSGLLICSVCTAHYVIADARSYACSGHWNGGACSNHIRVRRDAIERSFWAESVATYWHRSEWSGWRRK